MKIIFPIKFAIKNPEEVLGLVNRILMIIVLPLWSNIFSVKFKFVKTHLIFQSYWVNIKIFESLASFYMNNLAIRSKIILLRSNCLIKTLEQLCLLESTINFLKISFDISFKSQVLRFNYIKSCSILLSIPGTQKESEKVLMVVLKLGERRDVAL